MTLLAGTPGTPAEKAPSLAPERRLGRHMEAALVLAGFLCVSALLYGRGALPRLGSVIVGSGPSQRPGTGGHDQSGVIWALDWVARSIAHLHDPLSTMAIYSPHGWNLAWADSVPGAGAVLTPVTLLVGAVVSYNLLALAAPALGAWVTYLLCRKLSPDRMAPAVAGGLLFGFGPYETAETINHPNLALVALVPLAALLVLQRHNEKMKKTSFIVALGVVLAAQLLISTEILATTVMFGAIALLLWVAHVRGPSRRALVRTTGEVVAGLLLAGVLSAPFLYQAFHFGNPVHGLTETDSGLDLANLLTPTRLTWMPGPGALFWKARLMHATVTEQLAYLGLPLIVLLGAFAWSFRRTLKGRWLSLFMLIVFVLALGSMPIVQGRAFPSVVLPWKLIGQIPLLQFAVPGRFMLFLWLAAAAAVCLWLAQRPARRPLRWALFGLVALSLAPNATWGFWATPVDRPGLLQGQMLAHYVPRDGVVLALPYGSRGNSMLWQVEADFRYRMAGGYASFVPPPGYRRYTDVLRALAGNPFRHDLTPMLCSFLRYTHATTILLRTGAPGTSWPRLLDPLGVKPANAGGFHIYRIGAAMRPRGACGQAPMARRRENV